MRNHFQVTPTHLTLAIRGPDAPASLDWTLYDVRQKLHYSNPTGQGAQAVFLKTIGPTAAISTRQSLGINLRPRTPLPDATYIRQTRSTGTPPTR